MLQISHNFIGSRADGHQRSSTYPLHSLIADWHEGKSRSLAIGIHMTGLYVGQAVGGFGATIAATFSWHSTFHWFGIIGIAYSVVLALCLMDKRKEQSKVAGPEMQTPKESIWRGLAVVFSTWAFWVILIYFAVPSLPGWATKNWLPTLFRHQSWHSDVRSWSDVNHHHCRQLVHWRNRGGILSDNWVKRNIRGRIYTSAIGLGMTIPALVLLGFGHSVIAIVGADCSSEWASVCSMPTTCPSSARLSLPVIVPQLTA